MIHVALISAGFFVALLQTPPAPTPQPTSQPTTTSAPSLLEGPMRVEIVTIGDTRRQYYIPMSGAVQGNDFQMQLRLVGDRTADVTRTGRVIFSEAVTDNGENLIKPTTYSEQDRTETFRVRVTPDSLRERGIGLGTRIEAPSRHAATIKSAKGTLKVSLAKDSEDVIIKNIASLRGKEIDHPRLKELGIVIRVLPEGNPKNLPAGSNSVAFEFGEGQDSLRNIEFYDTWMTKIRAQPRNMQTNEGKPCVGVTLGDNLSLEDTSMIVQVYPKIETVDLPVELKDVPLP